MHGRPRYLRHPDHPGISPHDSGHSAYVTICYYQGCTGEDAMFNFFVISLIIFRRMEYVSKKTH